ncbi:MAG: histidine--tRNA ligase [Proteobacteria bacterium]|jgi:histidyl-tRNA synthetase|nr:histidine--tRNA ligase [Pseudomonadota bacterium]MDA0896437.1 histidine--tRNA ligase [Pseudomonadota bacterium]MDA1244700.1 histidine--tRNA ligase [Pseudomonadota bacterium]
MAKLQAIRGMNDILPAQTSTWQALETAFHRVVNRFGYQEIRFPVLEQTQLFKRSIGEVTDIVEKEMYSFDDRNGDNLSLRPEGTAGCVRAADQHGLLYNQQQRLWYQGPMFRHERPQKGRYRQFQQFGVEAFGMSGPDIDSELIQLSADLWRELDIAEALVLQINNIGASAERKAFGAALTAYLEAHSERLDDDARNRLYSNPLRILDSKNPDMQALLAEAPVLADYVSDESVSHFEELKSLLSNAGVAFEVNPRLVRGLDYYNNCVFEWVTDSLGAQGTVCGGGRYDGLVEQLGGKPTVAAGFAMGAERLVLMLETLDKVPQEVPTSLYIVVPNGLAKEAQSLAATLRGEMPEQRIISHCGGGKPASQLKRAFSLGARYAIILDPEGLDQGVVRLRELKDEGEEVTLTLEEAPTQIAQRLLQA